MARQHPTLSFSKAEFLFFHAFDIIIALNQDWVPRFSSTPSIAFLSKSSKLPSPRVSLPPAGTVTAPLVSYWAGSPHLPWTRAVFPYHAAHFRTPRQRIHWTCCHSVVPWDGQLQQCTQKTLGSHAQGPTASSQIVFLGLSLTTFNMCPVPHLHETSRIPEYTHIPSVWPCARPFPSSGIFSNITHSHETPPP